MIKLITLISLLGAVAAAEPAQRCRVSLTGQGVEVKNAPVHVTGTEILRQAGGKVVFAGSLRVMGEGSWTRRNIGFMLQDDPGVPCQLDEFDGGPSVAANPNHILDPDDVLVFQADVPAEGEAVYWVEWSFTPTQPRRQVSHSFMGDPMEASAWGHDLQLWNDQCLMGMRGPNRGQPPTANLKDNWGGGALILLNMFQRPVLGKSWVAPFPRGAVASTPCADAARWELPRPMVRGPVRMGVRTFLRDATIPIGKDKSVCVDVEHRAWLYDQGAVLCFEEILTPKTGAEKLLMAYEFDMNFSTAKGGRFWSSKGGDILTFWPKPDGETTPPRKDGVIFQTVGFDPWMAGHDTEGRWGYAVFADAPTPEPGETREVSTYGRDDAKFRFRRTIGKVTPDGKIVQRFWMAGWNMEVDPRYPQAFQRLLSREVGQ